MSNTEQNYAPPGGYANAPEPTEAQNPPTAPTQAQPLSPTDERRAYFHRLADHPGTVEYLDYLLDQVGEFADTFDPVPALLEACDTWLAQPFTPLNEHTRRTTRHILGLVKFLVELRSTYTCFTIEAENSDNQDQATTGEGEGHE